MSYSICIPEINLALFEEICCEKNYYAIIRKDKNHKKLIKYFLSKQKLNKSIRKKYVVDILRFTSDKICRQTLLQRIRNKDDEIVDDWNQYIKSSIWHIINEFYWPKLKEIKYPGSYIPERATIKTKKEKEKDIKNLLSELSETENISALSDEKKDDLLDLEIKKESIDALINSIGTMPQRKNDEHLDNPTSSEDLPGEGIREHYQSADKIIELKQKNEAIHSILAKLSDREGYIIKKIYIENMPQTEIAELLDISDSRVSQIKKRTEKKLKGLLKKKDIYN